MAPRSAAARSRRVELLSGAVLLAAALLATGCNTASYLAHVSVGQARLLLDREPLDAQLRARLSEPERAGLAAVEEALAQAESLGLDPSDSYRELIDRDGRPLVTLVVAAPRDRVEPVTWWFPIVGRVPYRGYFDPERARAFAERLAAEGYDTYVRPALLYSTLGWFDDPLPRSLLGYDRIDVLDTILHERVHETVFARGDVAYNESLATFVAERGVLERLAGEPELAAEAQRRFADRRRFAQLLEDLARDLAAFYADGSPSGEALAAGRAEIFERFRSQEFARFAWETERYAGFARSALSNAYVVAQRTYLGDLPCLERELEELGGDLRAFVARHREEPGRHVADCGARATP